MGVAVAALAAPALGHEPADSAARDSGATDVRPLPAAGWHGRAIQQPHKHRERAAETASYPSGWSAGAVRVGTGYGRAQGSRRVRDVQRELQRLGYEPGPVDGLFGPRTQAAVQWFQIKHGFRPSGVIDSATLAHLRESGAPASTNATAGDAEESAAPTPRPERTQSGAGSGRRAKAPATRTQRVRSGGSASEEDDQGSGLVELLLLAALAALALVLAPALLVSRRRRARTRSVSEPPTRPPAATAPAAGGPPAIPAPAVARPPATSVPTQRVVGYAIGETGEDLERHSSAIEHACVRRGWVLEEFVGDGPGGERPGLAHALKRLSAGAGSRLVVTRLAHLSRSRAELRSLLEWFRRNELELTVLDTRVDTLTRKGREAARLLLAGTARRRGHPSRRNGRSGRPAVADRPDLVQRIVAMRARGMTLQGIADALNRARVPTARGGAEWRPSSVQTALGYRRGSANVRTGRRLRNGPGS
jgi:DNA invertase Pin-like site-specific DNA recombinase